MVYGGPIQFSSPSRTCVFKMKFEFCPPTPPPFPSSNVDLLVVCTLPDSTLSAQPFPCACS